MKNYKIIQFKTTAGDEVFVLLDNVAVEREDNLNDALLKVIELEGIKIEVCEYPSDELFRLLSKSE